MYGQYELKSMIDQRHGDTTARGANPTSSKSGTLGSQGLRMHGANPSETSIKAATIHLLC